MFSATLKKVKRLSSCDRAEAETLRGSGESSRRGASQDNFTESGLTTPDRTLMSVDLPA